MTHVWLVLWPLLLQCIVIHGRLLCCTASRPLVAELLLDKVLLWKSAHIGAAKYRRLHMDPVRLIEVMVHIHFFGSHTPYCDRSGSLHLLVNLNWPVSPIKVKVFWLERLPAQQIFDSPDHRVKQGILGWAFLQSVLWLWNNWRCIGGHRIQWMLIAQGIFYTNQFSWWGHIRQVVL